MKTPGRPKVPLTDRYLSSLHSAPAPAGQRYNVWDARMPYFGVRVNDKGRSTFIVMRRVHALRNPIRFVVGKFPLLTVREAREKARQIANQLAEGVFPRAVRATKGQRTRPKFEAQKPA